jgi:hypothetical protein
MNTSRGKIMMMVFMGPRLCGDDERSPYVADCSLKPIDSTAVQESAF